MWWRPISFRTLFWVVLAVILGANVFGNGSRLPTGLVLLSGVVVACAIGLAVAGGVWRRDQDHEQPDGESKERIAELEARIDELSVVEERIAELENRLDFTERLLAQRNDPAAITPHDGD